MENFDEELVSPASEPENIALVVTEDIRSYIYETAKWSRFLSIVGFILSAIVALAAFGAGAVISSMPDTPGIGIFKAIGGAGVTILYLLFALMYFYPSLLLYKYAGAAKNAVLYGDQPSLSIAMSKMKSLFKFWGILTIVIIAAYVLLIIFMVALGGFAASMAR
ncbi:DUF5362 family protein [Pedobacter duraquae]|uniref:Uncharacterized protein n=1 Tax=Pedobacter duraquae TaxID=425511 RepID=A0A4R6IRG0_9SPHI|nr:DUF5362 family protein [Pedobacter duraquae]TDO24847.1 hypothetical protein CLV32_1140 [Pedobacter duraquae]